MSRSWESLASLLFIRRENSNDERLLAPCPSRKLPNQNPVVPSTVDVHSEKRSQGLARLRWHRPASSPSPWRHASYSRCFLYGFVYQETVVVERTCAIVYVRIKSAGNSPGERASSLMHETASHLVIPGRYPQPARSRILKNQCIATRSHSDSFDLRTKQPECGDQVPTIRVLIFHDDLVIIGVVQMN